MKTINPYWKVRLFWTFLFLLAMVLFFLAGCDPIKRAQKAIEKNDEQKARLASLCADQFPNIPSIKLIEGSVDTAGLLKWFDSTSKWVPYYTPGLLTPPDNSVRKDSTTPGNIVFSQAPKGLSIAEIRQSLKDSLVRALKRYIKPDTVKIKEIDSAKVKALEYALKLAHDSLDPVKKELTDTKLKLAVANGKASTRLWMLIGIGALVGVGIVLKIKRVI